MIHYHGTPITPRSELMKIAGKCFCVSYAEPRDADWCLENGQSVLFDNGAFTFHRLQAVIPNWTRYYEWLEQYLGHPHWAIVPDVIDGGEADNLELAKQWPHRRDCAAPVWHLGESLEQLGRLLDLGFGRICFGSSGAYWQVGSEPWERRADEAFNFLSQRGALPWVHMLRGLSLCGDRWPFASADSTNVAQSHARDRVCPERMARRIDSVQCPIFWTKRAEQMGLFVA